jgi:GNAT superfamily N-acetyltransferase
VPRLAVPTREQIRDVLAESHTLWGAGLSVPSYVEMWEELAESDWGRSWYSWRAWVDDDDRVLSSLKLYRPRMRLGGVTARARAIGAVFTPRRYRGRGYAADLIRAVLAETPGPDDEPGLLFTDIGVEYYAALGFAPLPCEDALGTLGKSDGHAAAGVRLRPMTGDDLDDVARSHDRVCAGRAFAILRDRAHWEFLLLRAESFFRRIDGSGLEHRFMIAEGPGGPIGYLVAVAGQVEWNVREAAAYDGSDATLARILAAGGDAAYAAGSRTVWGWVPRSWWPLVPGWRLRLQPRVRAIPMIRPPRSCAIPRELDSAEGAYISYLDQF